MRVPACLQVLERFPDDGIANAEEARVRSLCRLSSLLCNVAVQDRQMMKQEQSRAQCVQGTMYGP